MKEIAKYQHSSTVMFVIRSKERITRLQHLALFGMVKEALEKNVPNSWVSGGSSKMIPKPVAELLEGN